MPLLLRPDPPPGIISLDLPGARVWTRPGWDRWASDLMGERSTLHEALRARPESSSMGGRCEACAADGPDGPCVVRHFRRGGWMRLLGDRYLWSFEPRPFREAVVSERLRSRGLRTPEVVAAVVYPAGPIYRGDLVTRRITGSWTLSAWMDPRSPAPSQLPLGEFLFSAGRLVASLAANGVRHPDLHAGNILIELVEGRPVAWILDLDRCAIVPRTLSASGAAGPGARGLLRAGLLARLSRSLRKEEHRGGRRLRREDWEALRAGASAPGPLGGSVTNPATSLP